MTTYSVGARSFAYERRGSGPPLLVLNGFAATKADWDPTFIETLAEDHELFLVDLRGMGGSSDDGEPFAVSDLADDIAGAIEVLELSSPGVLGWSMGGFVALNLALERPEAVSKLVLLSTSAGGTGATTAAAEVWTQLGDLSGAPRQQASRLISLLFPPARAAEIDAEFGEVVAEARAGLPLDVVRNQWQAMEEWYRSGVADRLADIAAPALIASGSEDVVIPPQNSVALAAGIPNAWLARFPGTGHGFMADNPVELARLIALFLSLD